MPKQRSAPILFKQEVFYDLPDETNSLEIVDSLCDYEFLKGRKNEGNEYSCVDIQFEKTFNGYKSENSDSLVSSESSSDPDSSPPIERPKLSDVWNKFTVAENAFKEQEIKNKGSCKNISFADCQSVNKIENSLKNLSLQLNESSCSGDDTLRFLTVGNNQQNNSVVFCSSADIKDFDNGEIISDGALTRGSSSPNKEVCLSDMLTFENDGAGEDFKMMLFTEAPNYNEQRNLLSVVKNSSEVTDFSDLLGDIYLKDEPDIFCSSSLPSSSDVDSFLNSVNLIESVESPALNPETKLKNLGEVPCDENISLAALAEQHLQLNGSSNTQHTVVKSEDSFFSLLKESESFNNNWFSSLKSDNLYSTKKENCSGNMFDLWADFLQENPKEEKTNFETKDVDLQIVEDIEEKGDFLGSLDIDLTSCLKSSRPITQLNDSCVIKNDENFVSDMRIKSPFRFSPLLIKNSDDSPSKVNVSRSLFSKALSCKPRKNFSEMVKVLELQSRICSHYFCPSQVSDFAKPCIKNSIESKQSVLKSIGRRIFGQIPQCEVL